MEQSLNPTAAAALRADPDAPTAHDNNHVDPETIWQVITASSVGTVIEWYDFYIFGSLAAIIGPVLFGQSGDLTKSLLGALAIFGAGFVVRPFGAVVFGRHRRHGGAQVHFPGHAAHHGWGHVSDGPRAELRFHWHCRPHYRRGAAPVAGPGAGGRVRRRGHLRGRVRPRFQARLLHQLHSDYGYRRPHSQYPGDCDNPQNDGRSRLQGVGLAPAVPALGPAGNRLVLHPQEAARVAALCQGQGYRHHQQEPAARLVREPREPPAGAHCPVWGHDGAGGYLLHLAVSGVFVYEQYAEAGYRGFEHHSGRCDGAGHAAVHLLWLALRPYRAQAHHYDGHDLRGAVHHSALLRHQGLRRAAHRKSRPPPWMPPAKPCPPC